MNSYKGFIVNEPSKEFLARIRMIIDTHLAGSGYCSNTMKCVRIGAVNWQHCDNRINGITRGNVYDPYTFYAGARFVDEKDVTNEMIYRALDLTFKKIVTKSVEKPKGMRVWAVKNKATGKVTGIYFPRRYARDLRSHDEIVVPGRFIEDK